MCCAGEDVFADLDEESFEAELEKERNDLKDYFEEANTNGIQKKKKKIRTKIQKKIQKEEILLDGNNRRKQGKNAQKNITHRV